MWMWMKYMIMSIISLVYKYVNQILSNDIFIDPCTYSLYLEIGLIYESHPFSLRTSLSLLLVCVTELLFEPLLWTLAAPLLLNPCEYVPPWSIDLPLGDPTAAFHSAAGALKNGMVLVYIWVETFLPFTLYLFEISRSRMKGVA